MGPGVVTFFSVFSALAIPVVVLWIVLDMRRVGRELKVTSKDHELASDDFTYALTMLDDVVSGKRTRESAAYLLRTKLKASGGYDLELNEMLEEAET